MATRDELLCRLHDGEVPHSEAETLRAQITEEEQQKLHALTELDALLANTLTAEAEARELDLWAALSPQLSSQISSKAVDAVGASAGAGGKLLPLLRRRTVQITALLSTLAAAAGLLLMLRPAPHPNNHCDIEELDVAGENATVISVPDDHGHETALIWFDHQETDEWESL